MSALSDLFQDIADAIRTKTGDTAAMAPLAFPDNILSIEGGSGGPAIKVATGTFSPTDDQIHGITVPHNLGVVPDFISVCFEGLDRFDNYGSEEADGNAYEAIVYAESYSSDAIYDYGVSERGLVFYSNSSCYGFPLDAINAKNTETFFIGDDTVPLHTEGEYRWVAIANLTTATGGVTLASAEEVSF